MTRAHRMPLHLRAWQFVLCRRAVRCDLLANPVDERDLQSLLGLVQPATGGRRAEAAPARSRGLLPAGQQRVTHFETVRPCRCRVCPAIVRGSTRGRDPQSRTQTPPPATAHRPLCCPAWKAVNCLSLARSLAATYYTTGVSTCSRSRQRRTHACCLLRSSSPPRVACSAADPPPQAAGFNTLVRCTTICLSNVGSEHFAMRGFQFSSLIYLDMLYF